MLKPYEAYAPRANVPDANYPLGSIKNMSVPGAKDGTPLDARWGNNIEGFHQSLLAAAGIVASGQADKVGASQLFDALRTITKIVVPNFQQLRKTIASSSMLSVQLSCHTNEKSGGGGQFYWDASSTEVDDGGTIAAVENVSTGRWKRSSPGMVDVDMFGAAGDAIYTPATGSATGTDSAPPFQKLARLCDAGAAYWYVDAWNKDYLIKSTIAFKQPGVKVFSNSGARALSRESPMKKGNIFLDRGMTRAFDFGESRTTGNPADNWTVDGISIAAVWADATCDGFVFTSATDGPDRGIVISNCSGTYLKNAISFPSRGTSTAAATVEIKNCTFVGNDYAISADAGNVLGARIVSNQIEQNTKGAIKGAFNGPVYIADNMLEGQPNPIHLRYPEVVGGNRCAAVIERNYFEYNTGSYGIRFDVGSFCSLTVKNNYWQGPWPTDKVMLFGQGTVNLKVDEELYEDVKVTFNEFGGIVDYGSDFLGNKTAEFLIRQLIPGKPPLIFTEDYENFQTNLPLANSPESGALHYDTPYGNMLCSSWNEPVFIPANIINGQLFALNIFCRIDNGAIPSFELLNNAQNSAVINFYAAGEGQINCNGRWALLTVVGIANQDSSGLYFKSAQRPGSTGEFLVAGIAFKNYGAFVNDGSMAVGMSPVMPSRVINQLGSNYNQTGTAGTVSIIDTGISPLTMFGVDYVSRYSLTAKGDTNATSTTETAIAYGDITVINTGAAFSISYINQGSSGGSNPITVSAVFWDGTSETSTTTNTSAQIRIKIAGYLNNTGYGQVCRLVKLV